MSSGKWVFIVDDDVTYQKMMTVHLKTLGYEVRSYYSGKEADSIVEKPFAILLDHHMNDGETGLAVLKRLRKKMSRVPIIYMTSEQDSSVRETAKKSGAFTFIEKSPASLVKLRTTLDELETKATLRQKSWIHRLLN